MTEDQLHWEIQVCSTQSCNCSLSEQIKRLSYWHQEATTAQGKQPEFPVSPSSQLTATEALFLAMQLEPEIRTFRWQLYKLKTFHLWRKQMWGSHLYKPRPCNAFFFFPLHSLWTSIRLTACLKGHPETSLFKLSKFCTLRTTVSAEENYTSRPRKKNIVYNMST